MVSFIILLMFIYIFQCSAMKIPFLDEDFIDPITIDPLRNKSREDIKAKLSILKSTYLSKCLKCHRCLWRYQVVTMIRVYKSYLDFRGILQLSTICNLFLKFPQPFWLCPFV